MTAQEPGSDDEPMQSGPAQEHPIPLFLFSMPRSGSTLLQRILATHPEVATGPEPTFLLPLLHIGSATDVFATFDQRFTAMAVEDFLASTPNGPRTFASMVRGAAEHAYSHGAGSGARYFLDKTPKYHMVSDDLLKIFEESPAIVLWRNPLAVIASLMSTWGGHGGRWNLQHFRLDLFYALPKLIEVADQYADRICAVKYEDLVSDSATTLAALFDHLDLSFEDADVDAFGDVRLVGRVQDPNVSREGFSSVRSDRNEQWATILSNPLRKAWCRRYLRWLGRDRLAAMGYELETILSDLDAVPTSTKFLWSDLIFIPYDTLYRVLELGIFKKKLKDLLAGRRPLLAHK